MRFFIYLFLITIFLFSVAFNVTQAETTLLSELHISSNYSDIAFSWPYVYVSTVWGMEIIDVSNPSYIIKPGEISTRGEALGIFVINGYAYIADAYAGLKIADISIPSKPEIVGNVDIPGDARKVFVKGDFAYIASYRSGLQVVDVSIPSKPELISEVESGWKTKYSYDVTVSNNKAYVADGTGGLKIIDISDPYNPQMIGYLDNLPGSARAINLSKNKAYMVCSSEKVLHIIDVLYPEKPVLLNTIDIASDALDVCVQNDYVFIACKKGLGILKWNNTGFDYEIIKLDDEAESLAIHEDKVYMAVGNSGLKIVDIASGSEILSENISYSGEIIDICVQNHYAYIATLEDNIILADISDPGNPYILNKISFPGETCALFINENYLYIASGSEGLIIADISIPENPVIAGIKDTPGTARDVFVVNNYAYVADSGRGMQIIDISDPAYPVILGDVPTESSTRGIHVSGQYAYAADYSRDLKVIDIFDPRRPYAYPSIEMEGAAWNVYISAGYAYVAYGGQGLRYVDVSDPLNHQYVGYDLDTPGLVHDVYVSGEYTYIADGRMGMVVKDVSDLTDPVDIYHTFDTPGVAEGVFVADNRIYVADTYGILIFQVTPGQNFYSVSEVIDGDTIKLRNGRYIRYIGVDTPEIDEPYYQEAAEANKEFLKDMKVKLEFDVDFMDDYDRVLAYVYSNGIFVNAELVKSGYARASPYPPNTRYAESFKRYESEAKEKYVGIWNPLWDVNSDGVVDIEDIVTICCNMGKIIPGMLGDVDWDGKIDHIDLNIAVGYFGTRYGIEE
ncbi:hypothetical protein GF312_16120 [Candidatus Poribacteria bacterium]|nr:hypothetical protein [Candidatus Poribacteria bacterium]